MRLDELRDLDDDELGQAETNASEDMFRLRFQHQTGQLTNTAQLTDTRRAVARVKTIQNERARAHSKESSDE